MSISELAKELRIEARWLEGEKEKRLASMICEAADTIEALSAKLAAANIGRLKT